MRIDPKGALTLAALIRSDLASIDRIESHVSQFNLNNLSVAENNHSLSSLMSWKKSVENRNLSLTQAKKVMI